MLNEVGTKRLQGQICDILTPARYESNPTPSGRTDSHTMYTYIWGGGKGGGAVIDVEHSTYLQVSMPTSEFAGQYTVFEFLLEHLYSVWYFLLIFCQGTISGDI